MSRIQRVREKMKEAGINNLIVTNAFNLDYLSGFTGLPGDGCMVITPKRQVLITDDRYKVELESTLDPAIKLVITRDYYYSAAKELKNSDNAVGFESSINYHLYQILHKFLGTRLVVTDNLLEQLRDTKDASEIGDLKKSCQLVSKAYEELLKHVHDGLSEKEVSLWIYDWMLRHGAQKPSFDTIVASGIRSAMPHGDATDKIIHSGELVTVDFGFYFNDYTSDMTRTFAVVDPGDELKHVYEIVKEAQSRMIKAMHDGADGKTVDAAARDYIQQQGYGRYFQHCSGHSIGLDIHETPILGPYRHNNIYQNYVMTAEPGIYLPGKGGVRIEDDVLVGKDGQKRLTTAPRDLKII